MGSWFDKERIARLRQKQETSFTPTFLHRPMAILLLIPTADIPWVTPNRITVVSVLMRLVTAYLILPQSLGGPAESSATLWSAIVLWHLGSALDAADGALARYRGGGSLFGRYFDKVSDRVLTWAVVLGLSARAHEHTGDPLYILLAMTYVAMMSASSVAKWIELGLQFEMDRGAHKVADPGEVPAPERNALGWLKYLLTKFPHIFVVTEMDLPLWGSVALLTGREDLLFVYLGVMSVPYSLYTLIRRGVRMYQTETTRGPATQ